MSSVSTIASAAAALRRGETSSRRLVEAALTAMNHGNGAIGAVVARRDAAALDEADRADKAIASGKDLGPLYGIPVAIKDILATADLPTRAQSLALPEGGYISEESAVAGRLRAAGAVVVAKSATSEFAIGTPDENKPFPIPRNPWDLGRWAGGSSAGTASGLAAGFFLGGIGTDTGGSIRVPAAFCGITGLKPTFGLVSRFGCLPAAPSLDHVGPMARSARDCGLMLGALAGFDPRDRHSVTSPASADYVSALTGNLRGLVVGVDRAHYRRAQVAHDIVELFETAVEELVAAGAIVHEVEVPLLEDIAAATSIVLASEALTIHRRNLQERWTAYGQPTRLRIAVGAFYTAADYLQASNVLRTGRRAVDELLGKVDCIITLTAGTPAWRFEEIGLVSSVSTPFFTRPWNGVGLPAVSLPIGTVDGGLPIALQVAGREFEEATVLRVADAYQSRTAWHLAVPPRFSADSSG